MKIVENIIKTHLVDILIDRIYNKIKTEFTVIDIGGAELYIHRMPSMTSFMFNIILYKSKTRITYVLSKGDIYIYLKHGDISLIEDVIDSGISTIFATCHMNKNTAIYHQTLSGDESILDVTMDSIHGCLDEYFDEYNY